MKSVITILSLLSAVSAHSAMWTPAMYGFNVTDGGNRPVDPLRDLDFKTWWMHGYMEHPPNKGDVFALPAGQTVTTEIACTKDATSFFASGQGGDVRDGNNVCPKSKMEVFHTNGISDLGGCGLAIAYKDDIHAVKPEDFAIFSVNHVCVWNRFTDFDVPAKLPECPGGKCICSFFWIHKADSGGEEMYMNPFDCNVTGATASVPIPPPQVPRACPVDKTNCTVGAKQPFYWLQKEGNNIFNDSFDPPSYNDNYGFKQGAQNDMWDSLQAPPASSAAPTPSATSPISSTSSVGQTTPSAASVAAASSEPDFYDDLDPVNNSGLNATALALNGTDIDASNNGTQSSPPKSPIQHLLADSGSSRKVRACRARQVSGAKQSNEKRAYVLRKRVAKTEGKSWSWWVY
ncbi:hypothetical protein BDV93DRAFT_520823 [Ceratobasidium sp. AG-I]|nr:hypothetical protein BDV93DRAFT_520823 [Ceratobasidium sp. AG-I]